MQFTSNNQHIDLITLFIYALSRHALFTLIPLDIYNKQTIRKTCRKCINYYRVEYA
jgi:hypothetical protein